LWRRDDVVPILLKLGDVNTDAWTVGSGKNRFGKQSFSKGEDLAPTIKKKENFTYFEKGLKF